ncbi:MAG: sulfatase-like hydrolase/transferase [Phycisphaerales bacterium]|nr:MAG: sulfatase-like hydrolase/transferase [Phycisphaerales bacterium]
MLIVSDDHGRETLGCYGNSVIKTPNLDALAAEGVRFTNAFCTTASCGASRSVILSGLYNHANGQYGHQHSYHHFISFPNVKSLPVLLTEAGYRTGRIGKYYECKVSSVRSEHPDELDPVFCSLVGRFKPAETDF